MALQKTITTVAGIEVANAYHRVEHVEITSKTTIRFRIRAYVNTEKPCFQETVVETAPYAITGKNPVDQAYAYAKTLSEFTDAEDC